MVGWARLWPGGLEAGGFMETGMNSSDERTEGRCWTCRGSREMDAVRGARLKG